MFPVDKCYSRLLEFEISQALKLLPAVIEIITHTYVDLPCYIKKVKRGKRNAGDVFVR